MGKLIELLKVTFKEFGEDKAARLAAALSYYTVFSLAPILVIAIAVAGIFFGASAARDQIIAQIGQLIGDNGADMVRQMVESTGTVGDNIFASIIGILLLLFGATGLFGQLQEALNTIWEVQPKPRNLVGLIRDRFFSFTVVLGVAFMLLVSLVVSAGLTAFAGYLQAQFPGLEVIMMVINLLVSFAIITLLFSLMFKFLPDSHIRWRDVLPGGAVTALLFLVGQFAIGIYLGRGSATSAYGAAGSLVLILLWVYYSGMILFFGAEFTQTYARMFGKGITPKQGAVLLSEDVRVKQGIPHTETEERAAQTAGPEPMVGIPLPVTGTTTGVTTYIPETSSHALGHFEDEHLVQPIVREPWQPADKSIAALGGVLTALAAFTGALLLRRKN